MSIDLFLNILLGMTDYDPYFRCRPDATCKLGFTSYQKCSETICMLAYGVDNDLLDQYLRMSETTCPKAMYNFSRAVIAVFGDICLRE
jgi:hypothetical protein